MTGQGAVHCRSRLQRTARSGAHRSLRSGPSAITWFTGEGMAFPRARLSECRGESSGKEARAGPASRRRRRAGRADFPGDFRRARRRSLEFVTQSKDPLGRPTTDADSDRPPHRLIAFPRADSSKGTVVEKDTEPPRLSFGRVAGARETVRKPPSGAAAQGKVARRLVWNLRGARSHPRFTEPKFRSRRRLEEAP